MRLFTCGKKGAETRGRPPAAAAASPAAPAAHLEQVPVEDLQPAAGAHVLAGRRRGRGGGGRRRADGRRGRGAGRRAGVLLLQAAGQRLPVGLRLRAQPGGREPRPRLGRPRPPPRPHLRGPALSPRSRPGSARRVPVPPVPPAAPGPAYHGAGVRVEAAGAPLGQRLRRHHLAGESGRGRLRLHAPGERGAPYINRLKTINKNFLVAI